MRETTKEFTRKIGDKDMRFQIRKMDALKGSCLLKFVIEKLLPLFKGAQDIFAEPEEGKTEQEVIIDRTASVMEIIPKALESISEEELIKFEKSCLQTVDVAFPAGWQPVVIGDSFGVDELEYDVINVLLLCYDVVEFNFGGFFGGKGLSSLLPLQASSPSDA